MNPLKLALALTLALFALPRPSFSATLTLADRSQSRYSIVIASNALPSERYAASELQQYLEKICGARLPITTNATKTRHEILVGDSAQLRSLGGPIDWRKLGTDGFVLRTVGQRLIIAGGKPRGTLYGVYSLLEDKLGVRWFTPEVETVPRLPRLTLARLNETNVPALEYREVFWTEMMRDGDFSARHRLNGNHYKLSEKHGGRFVVYYPFVHSLDALVPPELYATHPEYFPEIKGKRVNGYVQRCLSNPGVVTLAKAKVRQWIKENPSATIISVSQNDTFNFCQCEQCRSYDEAEGSPAASLIRFVNAIAQDIELDFPNIRVDTLAYQYTRKPPKTLRPRPNVIIRLCSIECCFAHPLATCPSDQNRRFRDDIIAWNGVAPRLYVWDYTPNFAHYQQPFPNFEALQPNVKFLALHGVRGIFEQGNYSPGGNGELGPLRSYLLAKLLWNPETDLSRHTKEFLAGYYGPAAPQLRAYLELLEKQVRSTGVHAHIYDPPAAAYLNPQFLEQADEILNEAEAAATDPAVRLRVQAVRLSVWYVELATGRLQGQKRTARLEQFLQTARKLGVSHISESQDLENWARKQSSQAVSD
jgi:hypothetical protein